MPSPEKNDGQSGWAPLAFAAACSLLLIYAAWRQPKYEVEEYHNVKVLAMVAPDTWEIEREDGRFLYHGCSDFPNSSVIWSGYVARTVRYRQMGDCESIRGAGLGWFWERDKDSNVVKIQ